MPTVHRYRFFLFSTKQKNYYHIEVLFEKMCSTAENSLTHKQLHYHMYINNKLLIVINIITIFTFLVGKKAKSDQVCM